MPPPLSYIWLAAGELKTAIIVFIVAGSLSLNTLRLLSPLSPREHMAPQAQASREWALEGQHLQTVSLPSVGARGEGAPAGGAPRLPASTESCPGPQASACPEGPPLGTAWHPSDSIRQVIYFPGCQMDTCLLLSGATGWVALSSLGKVSTKARIPSSTLKASRGSGVYMLKDPQSFFAQNFAGHDHIHVACPHVCHVGGTPRSLKAFVSR